MAKQGSRARPWLLTALILLGGLLLLIAASWAFRRPLAGWAVSRWCTSQDFVCTLKVDALGPGGIEVRDLVMTAPDGSVPLQAAAARIDLDWPGLLQPQPRRVTVTRPVLRGQYEAEGDTPVSFGGLETLIPTSGAPSADPPTVAISDARLELSTPAGPLVVSGQFTGRLPYEGEVRAEIEPVELNTGDERLILKTGMVDLSFSGLRVDGDAALDLVEVEFEGLSVRDARLTLDMAGSLQPAASWTAGIGRLAYRGMSLTGADFSGEMKARGPSLGPREGALSGLDSLSVSGTVETIETTFLSAGHSDVSIDLSREGKDQLMADFALDSADLQQARLAARRATLSGQLHTEDSLSAFDASGDLVLEGAALSAPLREAISRRLALDIAFDAHADAFAGWLDRAASQFSFGSGVEARWGGEDAWSVVSTGTVTAKGPQGAVLTLAPQGTQPAVNLSDSGTELTGLLNLTGGTAPRIAALVRSLRFGGGTPLRIETGGASLKPWTAEGLTLAADLNEIGLTTAGAVPRLKAVGEIRVDGPLYGMGLSDTRLFGGVDAVFDKAGLRVQAYKTRCLGLDTTGVRVGGGISVADTTLQLCPIDGRVIQRSNGVASGRFDLSSVSIPFSSNSTDGMLSLEDATLDWRAGDRAAIVIEASRMSAPLAIGGKTLVVTSSDPTLGLESGRPIALRANVGFSEFSGSILPADLSLASASLDATLPPNGLRGSGQAVDVKMRDRGEDPLYEPLTGQLSATFRDGIMTVSGPLTTPRAGQTVANAELSLALDTLDGTANVSTPPLVFQPGGFQPTALSERVRGFLSNAQGELSAHADFTIDGGKPSGTGWVSVSNFGFDTLRLGAVRGVNGRIEFDNVLKLSSPPGQEVRIGQINPGIPLENGLIAFQLISATEAILERAQWPFAGGHLVAGRSDWTIAGTRDVIRISAEALSLTSLVDVFNLPDLKAEGTVSGTFPVEIAGPNAYIRDAVLTADDQGGTIAYTGKAAESASKADSRAELAFNALRDFRFSVLEIRADGNLSGDMLITMKLAGYSPAVLQGAPFVFNIGVDSKLMQLIRSGQRATGTDWLYDVVAESVAARNQTTPENTE